MQTPTIGRTLRSDALGGKKNIYRATDLHFISWMYVKIGVGSKC